MSIDQPPVAAPVNPYVGPKPFERNQELFGRDREVDELRYLLTTDRIVLLYSPSGAGKSSLVQAGLIPTVEDRFDVLGPTRVNTDPQGSGAVPNRYRWSALTGFDKSLTVDPAMTMKEYLTKRRRELNPLLIFDQFEEIVRVDPLDLAGKSEFFNELGQLLKEDEGIWALFVLREDYLAQLDPYARSLPTYLQNRYRIDRLTRAAAAESIEKPTLTSARKFAPGVVKQLVDNLAKVTVQQANGTMSEQSGLFIEPLHLQVVCVDIWERMKPDDLSIDPEDIGEVDSALRNYYESAVHKIAGVDWALDRTIREWFEFKLITADGVRNQVRKEQKTTGGLDNAIVSKLEDAYLIRAEPRGIIWYELAHDRLVAPIRERNRVWLAESDEAVKAAYEKTIAEAASGNTQREREIRDWCQLLASDESPGELSPYAVGPFEESGLFNGKAPALTLRHECLKKLISDCNRRFLDRNLETLRDRAAMWAAKGKQGWLLWKKDEFDSARQWMDNPSLEDVEKEFLRASQAEIERDEAKDTQLASERKQARTTRLLLYNVGVVGLIALGASIFGFYKSFQLNKEKQKSELAQRTAEAVQRECLVHTAQLNKVAEEKVSDTLAATVPVTASARPKCVVYLQIRKDANQSTEADKIKKDLEDKGCKVPGIETLTVGPSSRELRYFARSLKDRADEVAGWAGLKSATYVARYEQKASKAPQHFELWFEPGSNAASNSLLVKVQSEANGTDKKSLVKLVAQFGDSNAAIGQAITSLGDAAQAKASDPGAAADVLFYLQSTNPAAWTADQKTQAKQKVATLRARFPGDDQLKTQADALEKALSPPKQ